MAAILIVSWKYGFGPLIGAIIGQGGLRALHSFGYHPDAWLAGLFVRVPTMLDSEFAGWGITLVVAVVVWIGGAWILNQAQRHRVASGPVPVAQNGVSVPSGDADLVRAAAELKKQERLLDKQKLRRTEIRAHEKQSSKESEWTPLTARQSQKLVELLRNEPRHTLFIACQYPGSAQLARSFQAVFQELQWPLVLGDGGIDGQGTGIIVDPEDDIAHLLKRAIEQATPLTVTFGLKREQGATHPNFLVVGMKPIF